MTASSITSRCLVRWISANIPASRRGCSKAEPQYAGCGRVVNSVAVSLLLPYIIAYVWPLGGWKVRDMAISPTSVVEVRMLYAWYYQQLGKESRILWVNEGTDRSMGRYSFYAWNVCVKKLHFDFCLVSGRSRCWPRKRIRCRRMLTGGTGILRVTVDFSAVEVLWHARRILRVSKGSFEDIGRLT